MKTVIKFLYYLIRLLWRIIIMLMKKFNIAWIPGGNDTQVLEQSIDGGVTYSVVFDDMLKDVADNIVLFDATLASVLVRIGSKADGQSTVYSVALEIKVKDIVLPTVLTAATGLTATLIGEEIV